MDVLVRWEDGTINVVSSNELKTSENIKCGSAVQMFYKKKWYSGVVIDTEEPTSEHSVDDDLSMGEDGLNCAEQFVEFHEDASNPRENVERSSLSLTDPFENCDSDADPPYRAACEAFKCKNEVFSSCHRCFKLLCFNHFENYTSCEEHNMGSKRRRKKIPPHKDTNTKNNAKQDRDIIYKQYAMEGSDKEGAHIKLVRVNKQKRAKSLRSLGKEYISIDTEKVVAAKFIKERCNGEVCSKQGRLCSLFTDEERQIIFDSYHREMGNLDMQRQFVIRHTKVSAVKQKTCKNEKSRRQKTIFYYLTRNSKLTMVCKKFFLGTLGISERTVRTALENVNDCGMVAPDKRGGRQSETVKNRDSSIRTAIENHINKFPRVESHYCREKSTREYLHFDLNISKMYSLFLEELPANDDIPSITTYRKVFRSKNLSFHRPKKDQCSLCMTYKQGDEHTKSQLKDLYEKHNAEKLKVRALKNECKLRTATDKKFVCGSFDLQQVIYLPKSNDQNVFYKTRLSNFNLTYYDIGTKKCKCFSWHEGISKRGSCEIATCIYKVLQSYDDKNVQVVSLYSDGCGGQNKNSVMAAMLLLMVVQSKNIEAITLRYFESYHGQNEGDSVHSCISNAISHAGDLFLPSQLLTIFKLARRQNPYDVIPLEYNEFYDFKKLSQDLRILQSRDDAVKWREIMELKVRKRNPNTIFFKTSHLEVDYRSINLKRHKLNLKTVQLYCLNREPNKITKKKYMDLIALTQGKTPVIKAEEHKSFYKSLPHNDNDD